MSQTGLLFEYNKTLSKWNIIYSAQCQLASGRILS